ncbi:beta-glucosidase, partial [Sarracenia purpurea var. burkii]
KISDGSNGNVAIDFYHEFKAGTDWLYIYPRGLYDLLIYVKEKYNDPLIYITENGVNEMNDAKLTVKEACVDDIRKDYHLNHLHYLHEAI